MCFDGFDGNCSALANRNSLSRCRRHRRHSGVACVPSLPPSVPPSVLHQLNYWALLSWVFKLLLLCWTVNWVRPPSKQASWALIVLSASRGTSQFWLKKPKQRFNCSKLSKQAGKLLEIKCEKIICVPLRNFWLTGARRISKQLCWAKKGSGSCRIHWQKHS